MLASSIPSKFSIPFANSAGGAYIRTIPTASQIGIVPGAASLTDGFPPLNFLPTASGGIPPAGEDHNGILNQITKWSQWMAAGGQVPYDSVFSAAIGGYPSGAILLAASGTNLWISTADNNTTDPDTGGAGWVNLTAGRLLRTLRYRIVSGTQYVSINGGADTTSAAGTYTPIAGMMTARVYGCGGGGPGSGATVSSGSNVSVAAAGGGATYGEALLTAVTVGSSQGVTIGLAGAGASGGQGSTGGTTSLGAIVEFPGGTAGTPLNNLAAPVIQGNGVQSGAATGANIYSSQNSTNEASIAISNTSVIGGNGGDTPWGKGARGNIINTAAAYPASGYGAGGAGIVLNNLGTLTVGNVGSNGVLFVKEYS